MRPASTSRGACARAVAFLGIALLAAAPPAAAQSAKKWRRGQEGRDVDNPNQEFGVGTIPLGATAKGRIVRGFLNMISFEAVAGTRVTLELSTGHAAAQLVADLLPPGRTGAVALAPRPAAKEGEEADPRVLVLTDHLLDRAGLWTIRFGYTSEINGDYRLATRAVFPESGSATLAVAPGREATYPLDGLLGRKVKRLAVLVPDDWQVTLTVTDSRGGELDLEGRLSERTWGGHVLEIKDLPIESVDGYLLRVRRGAAGAANAGGEAGSARLEVEYVNPPLSSRTLKI